MPERPATEHGLHDSRQPKQRPRAGHVGHRGRLWRLGLCVLLTGCAGFSPQTIDTRPNYAFTPRASVAADGGKGLHADLCDRQRAARAGLAPSDQTTDYDCPALYGLLPAAIDDTEALRLRLLQAQLNDSGAPYLLSNALIPVGAYGLYRSIFGSGDGASRELTRLVLAGTAGFTMVRNNESPPRQQIRLAAAEALSCVAHGSVARYLYTRDQVLGARPAAGWQSEQELALGRGLVPDMAEATLRTRALREQLDVLELELARTPETTRSVGSHGPPCDTEAERDFCRKRQQSRAPVVQRANTAHAILAAEARAAQLVLQRAEGLLKQVRQLKSRIDTAHVPLLAAVDQIESRAAAAVQSTEAGVEALRRSVTGLRLAAQDFGLPATTAPASGSSAPGTVPGTPTGQAAVARSAYASAADTNGELIARAVVVKPAQVRRQLLLALGPLEGHLAEDERRAAIVKDMSECQFRAPGVKLVVDPPILAPLPPGSATRLTAAGGTELPTVVLVGSTSLKAEQVLKLESDTSTGRQALAVVLTLPADAAEQRFSLVFRNGDLVQTREVVVAKATGAAK